VSVRNSFSFSAKRNSDFLLIGAAILMTKRGPKIDQPGLCSRAGLALLGVLQDKPGPLPRIVAVSSMGMGDNFSKMPYIMQVRYTTVSGNAIAVLLP
jgi:hypothetical protein